LSFERGIQAKIAQKSAAPHGRYLFTMGVHKGLREG